MSGDLVRRGQRKLLQLALHRLLVRRGDDELVRLGSAYGGWWVPAEALVPGTIVVSAGVGEDTTFDEEMLARGCEVWAVDPTPRAQDHVQRRRAVGALPDGRFHFFPVGIWCRNETMRFYAPVDPNHVSHSVVNAQRTDMWFEAECWTPEHIMQEVGRDQPEVLKLDIEGAEVEVLRAMLCGAMRPSVLCVELDAPLPAVRTISLLRQLGRSGYRIAYAEGWNLLLLHEVRHDGVGPVKGAPKARSAPAGLRSRILSSPLAPVVVFPERLRHVSHHLHKEASVSARWLWKSREHTNFTYDLQPLSLEYLCWFVSDITALPVWQIRGFIDELRHDTALAEHIRKATISANRRWLADETVRFGRRLGWYAIVRAAQPQLVVETGTDKGLGSCVIASALLRNGRGQLITIDTNPESGYLIGHPYQETVDRRIGDSIAELRRLEQPIDLFLHDSLHTKEHELAELGALQPADNAYLISDNAHATDALAVWSERTGRRFAFFDERPIGHWHSGAGIGVSWNPKNPPGWRVQVEACSETKAATYAAAALHSGTRLPMGEGGSGEDSELLGIDENSLGGFNATVEVDDS